MAKSRADSPRTDLTDLLAPAFSASWTHTSWPLLAADINGVKPTELSACTFALFSIRDETISTRPCAMAVWSGVILPEDSKFISIMSEWEDKTELNADTSLFKIARMSVLSALTLARSASVGGSFAHVDEPNPMVTGA